jgi:hypothetical protein
LLSFDEFSWNPRTTDCGSVSESWKGIDGHVNLLGINTS